MNGAGQILMNIQNALMYSLSKTRGFNRMYNHNSLSFEVFTTKFVLLTVFLKTILILGVKQVTAFLM